MEALKDRPPYVKFKKVAVEDRMATVRNGHFTTKDEIFAVITPAGSKDELEYVASEWFERMEESVRLGRFNQDWLQAYKGYYQAFLQGEEVPLKGTPLANWPALSPAQFESLKAARLYTVEDVAQMNEEAITRVGMGARALKQRAEAFLEAASGPGKMAEENASLKIRCRELEEQVKNLAEQVDAMRSSLPPAVAQKTAAKAQEISL